VELVTGRVEDAEETTASPMSLTPSPGTDPKEPGTDSSTTTNQACSSYAPGDTGVVSGAGSEDATYTVETVDGSGAVLTYTIT
jgi:hypothetical protein